MWLRFDADHSGEIDHEETIGIIECILDGKVTPETFQCIVISIINMITRHQISSLTFKIEGDATAVASRMASESWTFYILHISLDLYIFLLQFSFTRIIFHFYFILSHIVSHTPPSNLLNSFLFPRRRVDSQDWHRWQRDSWWTGILDSKSVLHFSMAYNSFVL